MPQIVQRTLPVNEEDHYCFKRIAAKKKVNMKDLFHEWIVDYQKNNEVKV